ncbi:hypothetical protein GGH13_006812, partial [Coemansia sp. S155-1]
FFELRLSKSTKDDTVTYYSPSALTPVPEIAREQVASVARSLMRLVPAAVDVDMTVCTINDVEPNFKQLYEWLAMELCRGRTSSLSIYSWRNKYTLQLTLSDISGLTSITQGLNVSNTTFTMLAYRNASTLKTLEVRISVEEDWLDLIYGDANVLAVYADLVSLTLDISEEPYSALWTTFDNVEPFPALAKLDVHGGYPFDDDMLFRGNGNTLQSLRLPFGVVADNVLGRFDVLRRSGVTRMNSVRIGKIAEIDDVFVASNAGLPIEKQMHRILEVTSSLVLLNDTTDLHLYHSLLSAPNTAILQHLEFCNLVFNVTNIFQVVSALPSLSSFKCRINCHAPEIVLIPVSERPRTLYDKFHPLSHNLRALVALDNESDSAEGLAHVAMLLAVVCPSLRTVEVPPIARNEFSREIAWSMLNATYKPYADRLNGLIYWD